MNKVGLIGEVILTKMSKIKYFKNFVLCGDLNYRCLLCKETLEDEAAVERHLRWEVHRKSLKAQNCLPQYRKDSIFLLEKLYYCATCNLAMNDISQVRTHIDSDNHKNYKVNPDVSGPRAKVKLVDGAVFIGNTQINDLQWHGIMNKQCVLCDCAVSNISSHIYNNEHVINLIQRKINYVDDKYYRKINKETFQCFACEKTYPYEIFDNHFMNHTNNNSMGLENAKVSIKKDDGANGSSEEEIKPKVVNSAEMLKVNTMEWDIEMFAGIKDDFYDIDIVGRKITCKGCKNSVKPTCQAINDHLYKHKIYCTSFSNLCKKISSHIEKRYVQEDFDHGKARSQTAQYGNINFIKMNAGGSKGYCTLCDKFLVPNIEIFKQHVAGRYHKGHLELKGIRKAQKHERGVYKPVPMISLIKSLMYSANQKAFLIDGELVVAEDSFLLLKRIEHGKHFIKTKCLACDETIKPSDEKEHCLSWKHKSNLLAAKCISEDCFPVREIRPRLYHCCLCNASLPYWETVNNHLNQLSHKMKIVESVSELLRTFCFSKAIILNTNNDVLYLQLMNAVFNTKYVIKLDSK